MGLVGTYTIEKLDGITAKFQLGHPKLRQLFTVSFEEKHFCLSERMAERILDASAEILTPKTFDEFLEILRKWVTDDKTTSAL